MKQQALENEENPKDNKELDKVVVKSKTKKITNSISLEQPGRLSPHPTLKSSKKKSSKKLVVDGFIDEYDYQPDNGI